MRSKNFGRVKTWSVVIDDVDHEGDEANDIVLIWEKAPKAQPSLEDRQH